MSAWATHVGVEDAAGQRYREAETGFGGYCGNVHLLAVCDCLGAGVGMDEMLHGGNSFENGGRTAKPGRLMG